MATVLDNPRAVIGDLPRVPGYPDYAYTPDFRVLRITPKRGTVVGRPRKPVADQFGYFCWSLTKPGGGKGTVRRSVLVCSHFHGPRPDDCLALHRDGNPGNDTEANLYWGTYAQNMQDMVRHGRAGRASGERHGSRTKPQSVLRGESHGRAKITAAQAAEIRAAKGRGADLAPLYGIGVARFNQIRRGHGWQS